MSELENLRQMVQRIHSLAIENMQYTDDHVLIDKTPVWPTTILAALYADTAALPTVEPCRYPIRGKGGDVFCTRGIGEPPGACCSDTAAATSAVPNGGTITTTYTVNATSSGNEG